MSFLIDDVALELKIMKIVLAQKVSTFRKSKVKNHTK